MDALKSLFAIATLAACAAPSATAETTSAEIPPPLDKAGAVEAIVRARCGHSSACEDLTGVRRFPDETACVSAYRERTLVSPRCAHAIDAVKLTRCLDSIHTSGCNRSTDIAACSDDALCQ